jgi:glyoxylase-like metal-dependent hydrolase (beta-lactamase superfamily II)
VRAVAVHRDAIVVTSRLWQTTATAVRSGAESFLIDSPYFPDELELLPMLLEQSDFPAVSGLLATHADWDHLLARFAFPGLALGVASSSGERLRAQPGAAQRALRDADAEHYVTRATPLALGSYQVLPVPGRMQIGDEEIELHPTGGHTSDGVAFVARWAGLLVCGDYLSDVEIPMISPGGSAAEYRATLARLSGLVETCEATVPGHGSPHDRAGALQILDEDLGYLDALERGEQRPKLPAGRDTKRQREIHAENLQRLA